MKDTMHFCADFCAHPPPEPKFVVNSRILQEYIEEHRREYSRMRFNKSESSYVNFHSNVLSKEEKIVLINCNLHMPVWKDCVCS